jgi:sarcosine oxidase
VATLAARARAHGATIRDGLHVTDVRPDGSGVEITTSDGNILAERVVLAAGSWMPILLRQLGLDLPLTVTKEQLAFFAVDNSELYGPDRLPLVIHRFPDTTTLGSVFPIFEHTGIKLMIDRTGPAVEPDDLDRSINAESLERLRAYAMELIRGVTGEIIEAVSCRYTMTPDEDFVLALHPEHPLVAIASACSGHGFKFAPVIGEILADLVTDGRTGHDIGRFRLDRPALTEPVGAVAVTAP